MPCKAQRNSERKTLNNYMSTGWKGTLCRSTVRRTSCTKEEKSNTVYAHNNDACESRRCWTNESGTQRAHSRFRSFADTYSESNDHSGSQMVALDKEWDKLKNYQLGKKPKKERNKTTSRRHKKVELMSSQISRLDKEFQKYSWRVVLSGDAVKDDSVFFAVFTEQSFSASHMTAA